MVCIDVASRYAQALFNISASSEQMAVRQTFLSLFSQINFQRFFLNPHIKIESKKQLLAKIEDSQFAAFLALLIKRGKFKYLPQILAKYAQLITKFNGQLEATFICAHAIDAEMQTQLKERLKKIFGKTILLHIHLRSQIIGGAILLIENQMLDLSMKGRLEKLRWRLQWV